DDATVKCWGFNEHGELGYGDVSHRGDGKNELGYGYGDVSHRGDGENEMGARLPAVDLGAGRMDDATVKCWGANGFGQLGYGDMVKRGDDPN
ncbi:hypothetical protein T484DRAFT_1846132, partial [Baffinella frigidus]